MKASSSRLLRHLPLLALLVGILPFLACATIIKGSEQKVALNSSPSGAKVSVFDANGQLVTDGRTPITIPLKKGDGYFKAAKYKLVFEAPGYDKKEVWLTGDLEAGWYLAGNLLAGGFIGRLIVDPITGAMWNLRPETVSAQLGKAVSLAPDGALRVVLSSQVPEDLLAKATPLGNGK